MKTKRQFPGKLLFVGMLFATVANGLGQNLLVNGSFETPPVTNATRVDYPTNLFPWQTTTTNFEIWTNGWRNPAAGLGPLDSADGRQNLEILSEGTNVTVWQTVPTINGERYAFSFYYSPRPNSASDVFTVSLNSNKIFSALEDGSGLTNFDWRRFTTNFVATSNLTTLAFSDLSLSNGGSGTHIDGVVLEHEPWLAIENAGETLDISWLGISNETYQLQFRTNLNLGSWNNLGGPVSGHNTTYLFLVTPPSDVPQAFYRIVVGP